MSRRALTTVVAALLLTLLPAAGAGAQNWIEPRDNRDTVARDRTVSLDGVEVALRPGTRQVVVADATGGYGARVSYWERRGGDWTRRMSSDDARIGYGGVVARGEREQGTGTTPLGTFGLVSAFGRHPPRDAWDLDYREIQPGDYWVQDNASRFYNRYRSKDEGGFRWWLEDDDSSENLLEMGMQYEWAIVMDFNWRQVEQRGSGIFLHVNDAEEGGTAGCVSAPRWFIERLMMRLDPADSPVIAVGR